ncbi:MAG: sigma-70 family RNA polymerase sigma factor [Oscillospiraceae bacterium]|nr:sigma-70 family RNA polymerase sigma factor [Oscillospiraceae bacterium]
MTDDSCRIKQGILNHDEKLYRELIDEYGRLVWTVCSAILKNIGTVQDIEECVADVFIEVWKNPYKFNPEKGGIASFLKIIAKSKALNLHRRLRSKLPHVPFDDNIGLISVPVEEEIIDKTEAGEIMTEIGGLKEPDREIFYRRYCFEQKPSDIARVMNLPEREVRNRLYQSKKKLKNRIGGNYCETL